MHDVIHVLTWMLHSKSTTWNLSSDCENVKCHDISLISNILIGLSITHTTKCMFYLTDDYDNELIESF